LVNSPALVLADEPTGALDTANGRAVLDLLTTLNSEGTTIAIITHDRDIAGRLPRRVEILDGRLVADVRGGFDEDTLAISTADLADDLAGPAVEDTLAIRIDPLTDTDGDHRP
jgi:putative ABC transport system ATP-binding protein